MSEPTRPISEQLAALARANEELAARNRQLEEFASVVSHDLQAPLRTISSYCDRLERECGATLEPRAGEMLGRIAGAAERMRGLIQDLLAYARACGEGEPPAPVALGPLAEAAVANLRGAIAESGARVEIAPLPEVLGDATALLQLLQNLIGNALKFRAARDPWVRVTARRVDARWEIAVEDNGIGIAPEHRERVFGVFQRLHARDEYPGSGVGLAICRRIVERHGGAIRIDDGPAGGTVFRFTLPAAPADGANRPEPKPADA
jgi:signal transduction histidine kinase